MKNVYLLTSILVFAFSTAFAQKFATDQLEVPLKVPTSLPPGFVAAAGANVSTKPVTNLVSRPSFKKIFEKDFSTLAGSNNLPVNQIILSLNAPEIQVGQMINIFANSTRSIPFLSLYPYIKGKLNKNDEFKIVKNKEIDPGIDFGGKLIFNLYGLSRQTGYYFDPNDPDVQLFVMKTNAVKSKLSLKYSADNISKEIVRLQQEIDQYAKEVDSLIFLGVLRNDPKITNRQEKIYDNTLEMKPLLEMDNNDSKRRKFIADKIYEVEKEAPWKTRQFIWVTAEGNTGNQSTNIFRNSIIEENQNFRKNNFGASANYSFFSTKKKNIVVNLFAKYERSITNKFLADDAISLVTDSLISGSKYKISESSEVYNVSQLSDAQFKEKAGENILTAGGTFLSGTLKKWGFTANYRSNLTSKVTNFKIGLIIPVIMDNAKAEQSNIILELVMPDINTKSAASIKSKAETGQTVWGRSYINLKVGIPINVL